MKNGKNTMRLALLIFLILLTIAGCRGQEKDKELQEGFPAGQDWEEKVTSKTDPQETGRASDTETTGQIPAIFIQMLENNPLYRDGALSPDNRYYAYEERSSIILVQLPTTQEYQENKALIPKVLFTDGMRKESPVAVLEADYAQRLQQPLLTREELWEAELKLRSVYKWDMFHSLKFSRDGRYLVYLREQNFGSERAYTVYALDIEDNCRLYSLPVKEDSQYWGILWQPDNETLEIHLPSAESIGEGAYLDMRREWHIPSGRSKTKYYINLGAEDEKEISPEEAEKAIAEYDLAEAERERELEKWERLSVEEMVAALTPAELEEEYKKYFSLHPEQIELLKKRGYSDEVIAKMDSVDFEREESGWLLSQEMIDGVKRIYPELKEQDFSGWTHQKYNEYIQVQSEKNNAPPDAIKREILERGLPGDIHSRVAKEFHGWENMLAYTNEAIMAMYEAVQETDALFRKAEDYRLAVREAYLREVKR